MSFKGKQLVKPEKFIENRFGVKPDTTATTQSRDDLMKSVADKRKSDIADLSPKAKKQQIKTIWVKSLNIDKTNDDKSVAKLEIEYVDGKKEDVDFNIGTSGTAGGFENADRLYKELKKNMKMPKGVAASDEDIRLSMVRVAFNDWRIKWLYGKNKATDGVWAFSRESKRMSSDPIVKRERKAWVDKDEKNRAVVYRSGSTTIYRTEGEEDRLDEADKDVEITVDFSLEKPYKNGKYQGEYTEAEFKALAKKWAKKYSIAIDVSIPGESVADATGTISGKEANVRKFMNEVYGPPSLKDTKWSDADWQDLLDS